MLARPRQSGGYTVEQDTNETTSTEDSLKLNVNKTPVVFVNVAANYGCYDF